MTTAASAVGAGSFELLLGLRMRLLRNRLRQTAREAPMRLLMILAFIAAIWVTLYTLFDRIFLFLHQFREQSIVILPYIFHLFFVAMTLLLTFSSGILAYGMLYTRREPAWLLATSVRPTSIVAVAFVETVFFASWSLLLLGFPLMAAIGRIEGLSWEFYATFLAAFIAFIPIPGAAGVLAAWAVAMWAPLASRRVIVVGSALALVGVGFWWAHLWRGVAGDADSWLSRFLAELSILRTRLLPSTWVTEAIRSALYGQSRRAGFYLFVTAAHAAFFGWLAIAVAARWIQPAFGRAHGAARDKGVLAGRATRVISDALFRYLPPHVRSLILKDLRTFVRDPMQWSQLAILLGLLALYLGYLPRLHPSGFTVQWQALLSFLNYCAVSLILSTFTSRFVFPMISLEGRQMWLLGRWPLPRATIVWAKFDFALAVTAGAAMVVTALSIRALSLPWLLALVQVAATLSTCVGLCGLAVGLGARVPDYRETSAARIANGVGGTINLVASMLLVLSSAALMGVLCYRSVFAPASPGRMDWVGLSLCSAQVVLGFGAGAAAMRLGVRRFERTEF